MKKFYKVTEKWTFGFDFGDSGCYWYFCLWCHTRYAGKPAGRDYGLGEFRFYRSEWWKTTYIKDKNGKLKIDHQGIVIDRKGGWRWRSLFEK